MTRFRHVLAASAMCFAVAAAPRAPQQQITPGAQPAQAVAPISLSDADGQELVLEELSARTAIQGMLSLTELELRFRNPKARRIEGRFTCTACGKRGADVHPDFNWSAGWAIAKAITGLTNCRSQLLKKRWRARNDVAL